MTRRGALCDEEDMAFYIVETAPFKACMPGALGEGKGST